MRAVEVIYSGYIQPFLNEYGIYLPYFVFFMLIWILSKVTVNNSFLFKKPNEINYSKWFIGLIKRTNYRHGFLNLLLGLTLVYFDFISYLGWAILGIGVGLISVDLISRFFPHDKSSFKTTRIKLGLVDSLIIGGILYYFFIDYFQLVWPSLYYDKELGMIRYKFYWTGMSIFNIVIQVIIMLLGKHRISTLSVIVLFFMCNWHFYNFLDKMLEGGLKLEFKVLTCLIFCSLTIFVIDSARAVKRLKEAKSN